MGEKQLLTVREVADELGVTVVTVRRWIRAGALGSVALGDRACYRVQRSDLDALMAARYRPGRESGCEEAPLGSYDVL